MTTSPRRGSPRPSQLRACVEREHWRRRMECVRFLIGVWLLDEQRPRTPVVLPSQGAVDPTPNERQQQQHEQHAAIHGFFSIEDDEDPDEAMAQTNELGFRLEFRNLYELLINPHHLYTPALDAAIAALESYVRRWPGDAMGALERWWRPRRCEKALAVATDLQLVFPGLWIASGRTIRKHPRAFADKGITHLIECVANVPNADDDFEFGSTWAQDPARLEVATRHPMIEHDVQDEGESSEGLAFTRHRITLHEIGRMEFLVRRRERRLHPGTAGLDQICETVGGLLDRLRQQTIHGARGVEASTSDSSTAASATAAAAAAAAANNTMEGPGKPEGPMTLTPSCDVFSYVESWPGVAIYCEKGNGPSIAVCLAVLMHMLQFPYGLALHVVHASRAAVEPSIYYEHLLREYEQVLIERRETPATTTGLCRVDEFPNHCMSGC